MKKITGILLLVLGCASFLAGQQYQYYYRGEPLPLELNTKYAYLLLQDVSSPDELAQLVGGVKVTKMEPYQIARTLKQVGTEIYSERGKFWAEVQFTTEMGKSTYLKKLDELQQNPAILQVSPYFKNDKVDKIGMSNLFLVRTEYPEQFKQLQEYATNTRSYIVGQNKFMANWYTLSVDKNSTGNAMELANQFFLEGGFSSAQPDLMTDDNGTCVNDSMWAEQWGFENTGQWGGTAGIDINICDGWDAYTTGDNGTVIAILDHGYEQNHPDLIANNVGTGFDSESGTSPALVLGNHGTACAGVAAASGDNTIGVSGVAPDCGLMSISNSLAGSANSRQKRADGINWAYKNGAAVISNSWLSGVQYAVIDDAIDSALVYGRGGLGTVMVFATGNGDDSVSYPANSNPSILAVGAMSMCGERKNPASCDGENWWGSDYGSQTDVVAPGVKIPTTDRQGANGYNNPSDYHATFNGTSSATPHVAGLAGLIISLNPCLTEEEVRDIIEQSAQKVGGYTYSTIPGRANGTWNLEMGYGLIDVEAALAMVGDLYIQNTTISVDSEFVALSNIFAGSNVTTAVPAGPVTLDNNAVVDFRAGNSISIQGVFTVEAGVEFTAIIDPGVDCADLPASRMAPDQPDWLAMEAVRQEKAAQNEAVNRFEAYPNPFGEALQIRYEIAREGATVRLGIYDLYGNRIADAVENPAHSSGKFEISLPGSADLSAGVYFLLMEVDGQVFTKKVVKASH